MAGFALTAPKRTIFGRGARVTASAEVAALGARVLLVRGRSVAWVDALAGDLTRIGCRLETVFTRGEPDLEDVRSAVRAARAHRADCVLSVGGGAAIDLGKAVAGLSPSEGDVADHLELGAARTLELSTPLPFIAIPTTAGTGAEATRNAVIGVPERRAKISLRDSRLVPDLALVDPALTDHSPRALTLASGLDAVTQLVESYLCTRANPVTDALCRSAIPSAIAALHRLMKGEDSKARDDMARASYLSGIALANSGLGIVHGLASVIGGRGAAHGAICGRLLAPGLAVNYEVLKQQTGSVARFHDVEDWLAKGLGVSGESGNRALRRFVGANGLPDLQDLGVLKADVEAIAELSLSASSTRANPVVLTRADVIRVLDLA
ncbi:iron-containing alcohol dehydrogenase [Maritimibacter sp. DP1N21-5]|uniref:iron-containing alcohol dehydrogenase n=1 Tax=Maritimibacter sp. DP1N21-5 TaxID=2836867 RepID=UPI001C45CC63|nr:iron-containing alcohol dehydrogenase [Maritimibacter sp. DP1N21-5]MBV7410548.1 iron-containing alcohol dehydrogenase [Maritimibacter sp. DP1N21-5]